MYDFICRLSKLLKLPPLLGRPPCPPRVYKKLYGYLEQALVKASLGSRRDTRGGAPDDEAPRSPSHTPRKSTSNASPSKRALPTTPSKAQSSSTTRKRGANGVKKNAGIVDAPSWTTPIIRQVCKTLSTRTTDATPFSRPLVSKSLTPHMYAGVSSVLSFAANEEPRGKGGSDQAQHTEFLSPLVHADEGNDYKERVMTLIVTLYFVTLARRRPAYSGRKSKSTARGRKLDVDTHVEMTRAALRSIGLVDEQYLLDVDTWFEVILTRDWTRGREWFDNIPGPSDDDNGDDGEQEEGGVEDKQGNNDLSAQEDEDNEDEIISSKRRRTIGRSLHRKLHGDDRDHSFANDCLLPGLGTMMQDRLDWYNDERRADYVEWKKGIMKRIRLIERSSAITT